MRVQWRRVRVGTEHDIWSLSGPSAASRLACSRMQPVKPKPRCKHGPGCPRNTFPVCALSATAELGLGS